MAPFTPRGGRGGFRGGRGGGPSARGGRGGFGGGRGEHFSTAASRSASVQEDSGRGLSYFADAGLFFRKANLIPQVDLVEAAREEDAGLLEAVGVGVEEHPVRGRVLRVARNS